MSETQFAVTINVNVALSIRVMRDKDDIVCSRYLWIPFAAQTLLGCPEVEDASTTSSMMIDETNRPSISLRFRPASRCSASSYISMRTLFFLASSGSVLCASRSVPLETSTAHCTSMQFGRYERLGYCCGDYRHRRSTVQESQSPTS